MFHVMESSPDSKDTIRGAVFRPEKRIRHEFRRLALFVEMVIDLLRQPAETPVDGLQIRQIRPAHRLGRSEMRQQRAFARGADARDIVQRGLALTDLPRLARCVPMAKRCASSRSR